MLGETELSKHARAILKVLRKEWEMATSDLREEAGVKDRAAFIKALDELQGSMIVVPSAVAYVPKFTYIWELAVGRFPDALVKRVNRETAVREIARCFLNGAGMTFLASRGVTGLARSEPTRQPALCRRDATLVSAVCIFWRRATIPISRRNVAQYADLIPIDNADSGGNTHGIVRRRHRAGFGTTAARSCTVDEDVRWRPPRTANPSPARKDSHT